jgi:hypothetical protein
MKVLEYTIVSARSADNLLRSVNEKMFHGWAPLGGLTIGLTTSVTQKRNGKVDPETGKTEYEEETSSIGVFAQAMIRTVDVKEAEDKLKEQPNAENAKP